MRRLGVLVALLLCIACQSDADPPTTAVPVATTTGNATTVPLGTTAANGSGEGVTVTASDFSFSPAAVTVSVGESVTWVLGEGAHTTTSGTAPDRDGTWDQALTADAPFSFTFEEPGSYAYFCRFHADFMSGTVTVEP
jgi:plastocyanin